MSIHPTAIVHPGADIAKDVDIGPFAIIGEHVRIRRATTVGPYTVIDGWTEIGEDCRIFSSCSIGTPPQDLKYGGEQTTLRIGDRNTIREFCTIHRGTVKGGGHTVLGSDNFLMAYVHIAHDCRIGNHIIMANAATLGGHIEVGDYAVIGGLAGIHQFVRIGPYAMVGACSAVSQDVPPYLSAVGNRARLYGLNSVGLRRNGFDPERLRQIKRAYHIFFRSSLTLKESIKKAQEESGNSKDIELMVDFINQSKRGVCR